ncbi:hypothetical protein FIBSPDRAFT_952998 [Athelia psychrophila]|uniref:Uncharacterized protein n=1 Tax=Athelia psychrophila TaxID=1759441 RepID=A0A166KYN7_9AGAM|nr:hypothetical protein FIBSPDRAFT_952998 [Fibularhizoctonia sp. CBS 109695]
MRQISEERRHALGLLLKRLEEFAAARLELLRQLEELDVQARAVQQTHNAIHNADAPTSDLPDEILAMIFEEGILLKDRPSYFYVPCHFGVLVSHVSHRWREVALANSRLWTSIPLIRGDRVESEVSSWTTMEEDGPRPKGFAVNAMSERAAAFPGQCYLLSISKFTTFAKLISRRLSSNSSRDILDTAVSYASWIQTTKV